MKESNYHPQYPGDDEKEPQETASGACRRSEGLSSTDLDLQEIVEACKRLFPNISPDDIRVVQVLPYVSLEIPHKYIDEMVAGLKGGHTDNPGPLGRSGDEFC